MTNDVDVGDPGKLTSELKQAAKDAREEGPDVRFHVRPPGLWLASADWTAFCVDVSDNLGLENLSVELMHPIDLIISKMIRWNERDAEDVQSLFCDFDVDVGMFARRLNQAVSDSMVTDWSKTQLRELLEELFPDEDELRRARELTPALKVP